ncbi:site-specific integrase [Streptomyces sp. NBC_01283]|uniref:tyrosine-type recombinase/integrase n=1 Tax=Streptomyces sp. NBC_01283 TaxID=2903812 RepID=UPI00352FBF85|nr:site-specific integrase [Streptomyces sp. NBC_01283]
MAGHIQDRWFKTENETDADGKTTRVKTDRHGKGLRYRARYVGPDGTEKSKSFRDGQKRLAEKWLSNTEADMGSGQYVDPRAAKKTFQQYTEKWLSTLGADPNTIESMNSQLRLHAFPYIGSRPLGSFKPEHIREWVAELEASVPGSYGRIIYANVRSALSAAVDDGYLSRNPVSARSVKPPAVDAKRVVPWSVERVFAVQEALPDRYQAMADLGAGCGMRQGEILGIAVDAIDFEADTLHVVQQLKLSGSKPVFALPKGGKTRDVPLPGPVADALRAHMKQFPPVEITLPWKTSDGPKTTRQILFTAPIGNHVWRTTLNETAWKPALVKAGVIPEPETKGDDYAAAREHGMHALRHFYASALLDGGENIKAVSEYLGHSNAALTLRIYAHLMPSSRERTRKAIATVYDSASRSL